MYYARWNDNKKNCYWTIYQKRWWFFDKKISKFDVDSNIYIHEDFGKFVKPELERLRAEGKHE